MISQSIIYTPEYSRVIWRTDNYIPFYEFLIRTKSDFFISERTTTTRIVFNSVLYIFTIIKNSFPIRSLMLFKKVRCEANEYLKEKKEIKIDPLPTNYFNKNISDNYNLISTDINSAYWTIAKNFGIIKPETFEYGKEFKTTSLASLAVLGSGSSFIFYKNGIENRECIIPANDKMKNIYNNIRYSCFGYMNEVKETLGKDFHSWHTDEVIYKNTNSNITVVHSLLEKNNLSFKDKLITI